MVDRYDAEQFEFAITFWVLKKIDQEDIAEGLWLKNVKITSGDAVPLRRAKNMVKNVGNKRYWSARDIVKMINFYDISFVTFADQIIEILHKHPGESLRAEIERLGTKKKKS